MLNNILRIKATSGSATSRFSAPEVSECGLLTQQLFTRMLRLERKRTERSSRRFVLMLLEPGKLLKAASKEKTLAKILSSLTQTIRDTDIAGWYKEGATIGVIFTEVGPTGDASLVTTLSAKVSESLYRALTVEQVNEIRLSFHVFPEDWDDEGSGAPINSTLRINLAQGFSQKTHLKRSIDIVGSLAALFLCLPVLVAIAIAIKLTSKGPVLFRQVRLGQYGKRFTFLKFRSMYHRNDSEHPRTIREAVHSWRNRCGARVRGRAEALQIDRRSAGHARGPVSAQEQPGRITSVPQRSGRPDVTGRSAASRHIRVRSLRSLAQAAPAGSEAGHHWFVASRRSQPGQIR